jgi:hypothetical protein
MAPRIGEAPKGGVGLHRNLNRHHQLRSLVSRSGPSIRAVFLDSVRPAVETGGDDHLIAFS